MYHIEASFEKQSFFDDYIIKKDVLLVDMPLAMGIYLLFKGKLPVIPLYEYIHLSDYSLRVGYCTFEILIRFQ